MTEHEMTIQDLVDNMIDNEMRCITLNAKQLRSLFGLVGWDEFDFVKLTYRGLPIIVEEWSNKPVLEFIEDD